MFLARRHPGLGTLCERRGGHRLCAILRGGARGVAGTGTVAVTVTAVAARAVAVHQQEKSGCSLGIPSDADQRNDDLGIVMGSFH